MRSLLYKKPHSSGKLRYEVLKESMRKARNRYYEQNKEQYLEYHHKYYQTNKAKCREYAKTQYLKNREHKLELQKKILPRTQRQVCRVSENISSK